MKRVALFIGVNDYKDKAFNSLTCARKDAEALKEEFARHFNNTVLLRDNKVTPDSIINSIETLTTDLTTNDLFLFYFAGHGYELNGEHLLICPKTRSKLLQNKRGVISLLDVRDMSAIAGVKRLFILDCCRSDLFSGGRAGMYRCPASRDSSMEAIVRQDDDDAIIPPLILHACGSGQQAYEDTETGQGYFTKALLNTIEEKKNFSSFDDFKNTLEKQMKILKIPGQQNISWNGTFDFDIPLFKWTQKKEEKSPAVASEVSRTTTEAVHDEVEKQEEKEVVHQPVRKMNFLKFIPLFFLMFFFGAMTLISILQVFDSIYWLAGIIIFPILAYKAWKQSLK